MCEYVYAALHVNRVGPRGIGDERKRELRGARLKIGARSR